MTREFPEFVVVCAVTLALVFVAVDVFAGGEGNCPTNVSSFGGVNSVSCSAGANCGGESDSCQVWTFWNHTTVREIRVNPDGSTFEYTHTAGGTVKVKSCICVLGDGNPAWSLEACCDMADVVEGGVVLGSNDLHAATIGECDIPDPSCPGGSCEAHHTLKILWIGTIAIPYYAWDAECES